MAIALKMASSIQKVTFKELDEECGSTMVTLKKVNGWMVIWTDTADLFGRMVFTKVNSKMVYDMAMEKKLLQME